MKKYIALALLLSFACLLYAQSDITQHNSNNEANSAGEDTDDQEERCEADQLSLLRRPSYTKVEMRWGMSSQPRFLESGVDTTKEPTDEKDDKTSTKFNWKGCCIAGGFAVGLLVLVFVASMGQWLSTL
jgi:hypothetical protein